MAAAGGGQNRFIDCNLTNTECRREAKKIPQFPGSKTGSFPEEGLQEHFRGLLVKPFPFIFLYCAA